MIPQQSPANVLQIATSLAQNTGHNTPAVATFAQDRSAQIRFPASPQLLTKLMAGQMACGASEESSPDSQAPSCTFFRGTSSRSCGNCRNHKPLN
ncbi:hypothetical protein F7725_027677 [Dissostichus mawsoni]|uniref:Uncharacterized protein n=1 Tax=Dissostichus mawsoni TaxID=36200 RepID=A0A7J5XEI1_DISMA|nr:hypothetical protein F7725_027677 [Dissostichus mawsoni]